MRRQTLPRGLQPNQQRFVDEHLKDLNATHAVIRAGYSARMAKQQGGRLLTHADVAAAVQDGMKAQAVRTGIDQA